ncbi:MAG TPA: TonB-dependent receptor, partial [Draconibacterium sp.]|nr:TonB-dependent receptor [Draconibacterium sp.]
MRYFYLLIALFLFFSGKAQTIQVLDKKTGHPLDGVILKSQHSTTQTDSKGTVRLDAFGENDEILFKLPSYLEQTISKHEILEQGNIVQLSENPIKIDEVVVSVNRWEQSRAEVPQSVVSIPAADVLHYQPQTTADLLGTGNGVYIQKSQMGGGSPMIRGFAANRLLIVVDGIRMNNAIYRSGNLQNVISIDPNSLESTEVILGPGSVIYGSDALGGVMSFTTLKPKLSTHKGVTPSGKVMTRFSSANFEKTIHATINLGGQKWAALVSSTFTDYDDLRMGSKARDEYKRPEYVLKDGFDGVDHIIQNNNDLIQHYTGYSQFNILGKLRYRPSDKTELILSANHSQTSNIPRYDRLIVYRNDKLRYGEWYYGPQVWSMFSGQLILHPNSGFADKINLQTAFQKYAESRYDRAINKSDRNGRKEDLSIYSINLDLAKTINAQNEFFYGAESYYNLINSKGTVYNLTTGSTATIPSRYPGDSDYGSAAAYISYKHRWQEKLILQAGTRYTYTWMSGNFSQADYGFPFDGFNMKNSALIGNLGFVWHPSADWQVNVDLSTGFRSPNIDDVAKVFDSEPGNVIVPNPNLEPEYTRTIDAEIKKTFADKA